MEVPALPEMRSELKQAAISAAFNFIFLLLCLTLVALYFVFELFMRPLLWAVLIGSFLYPLKRFLVLSIIEWLDHISLKTRAPLLWAVFLAMSKIPEYLFFWLFHKPERVIVLSMTIIAHSGVISLDQGMNAVVALLQWISEIGIRVFIFVDSSGNNILTSLRFVLYTVEAAASILSILGALILISWRLHYVGLLTSTIVLAYSIGGLYLYPLAVDLMGFSTVAGLLVFCVGICTIGYFSAHLPRRRTNDHETNGVEGDGSNDTADGAGSESEATPMSPDRSRNDMDDDYARVHTIPKRQRRSISVSIPRFSGDVWASFGLRSPSSFLLFDNAAANATTATTTSNNEPAKNLRKFSTTATSSRKQRSSKKSKSSLLQESASGPAVAMSSEAEAQAAATSIMSEFELNQATEVCILIGVSCMIVAFWELLPWFLFWAASFGVARYACFRLVNSAMVQSFSSSKIQPLSHYLFPAPIASSWRLFLRGDRAIIRWLIGQLDSTITILIIFTLIATIVFASFFFLIQLRNESQQIAHQVWAQRDKVADAWTNIAGEEFGKFYQTTASSIAQWFITGIEQQIQSQTDFDVAMLGNTIMAFPYGNFSISTIPPSHILSSGLLPFIKEHINMLTFTLKTIWTQVVANMQLLWWLFTRVYSVLNYFISLLLFLTALFYLLTLSSAHGNYEPYNKILFMFQAAPHINIESHIRRAIEQVFESSIKIALFHGMWCWLTYNLFGCSLTYTTSLTMASVAVTALIGTYWLSLPAVLQLWLFSNRPVHALLLFLLHLGATWFVDPLIYGQIEGSHHYVTGLSVVGGLYFLGLEGVIIGPMLLCTILIFLEIFREYTTVAPNAPLEQAPSGANLASSGGGGGNNGGGAGASSSGSSATATASSGLSASGTNGGGALRKPSIAVAVPTNGSGSGNSSSSNNVAVASNSTATAKSKSRKRKPSQMKLHVVPSEAGESVQDAGYDEDDESGGDGVPDSDDEDVLLGTRRKSRRPFDRTSPYASPRDPKKAAAALVAAAR